MNAAMTHLATREREVLQQGENIKKEINQHAQQLINDIQRSRTRLTQQVDTIVQQKTQTLATQRQQAQKIHTQLQTCQDIIEHNLKELTQQQILTQKHTMMDEMNTATQHVDPTVFQPIENVDIEFSTNKNEMNIGAITCKAYSEATLEVSPCLATPPKPKIGREPVNIITGLDKPRGIAVCDNGDIVVAEWGEHCITILKREGRKMKAFGGKGTTEGKFTNPTGVAISSDGHILVTDNHRLQKVTTDGMCVKSVGTGERGSGNQQFVDPDGIAVHPTTGQIFIADSGNYRIQVFTNDLTFSHTITRPSGLFSQRFDLPCDVALDNEGYLYVAEFWNSCITKLSNKKCIKRFGSKASAFGQLSSPTSLTIHRNLDLVYVCDRGNDRVSVFDTDGKFLHHIDGHGILYYPYSITIDTLGNLYVSDTGNNRIVVF